MLQVENVPKNPIQCFSEAGGATPPLQYSFPERYEAAYITELNLFVDIVTDPTLSCPVTKETVLLTSKIADACEQSMKEGRMVTFDPSN